MKAKEVMRLLRISRPTLCKYVKDGNIKVTQRPNGRYDYDKDSVYKYFNFGVDKKNYIYARVSTHKQRPDLENQVQLLKQFCFSRGVEIHDIFQDIASGISFDKRKEFFRLLDDVLLNKVDTVVITYKDRLSRVGFELFKTLFEKFNTKIIVMSEVGCEKLDSAEIFEEIVSLLHCYSMKLYSKRKHKKIEELISKED